MWENVYLIRVDSAEHHHQKLQEAGKETGGEEEAGALHDPDGGQWYTVVQSWHFGIKTDLAFSPASASFLGG